MRPSCPQCKVALRKDRIKGRHIDSLQGYLEYQRMRYQCHECGEYYYPTDYELDIHDRRMSDQKEKQLALLNVHMPYKESKKVCTELTKLGVGRMTIHRTVQCLGAKRAGVPPSPRKISKFKGQTKRHVTADGVMIHIRKEGWKEAKVGSVYEVDQERKAREMLYTATVESREVFSRQLDGLAREPDAC